MRENIANFFTLINLLCGCVAIILLFNDHLELACLFVIVGGFFDFIDGFIARGLGISSELGKQLDSLSDLVTFGVVPGLIAHTLLMHGIRAIDGGDLLRTSGFVPYIPLIIPIFSAIRLGKFNIDERQTTSFIGMPTPANGFFWISLPLIRYNLTNTYGIDGSGNSIYDIIFGIISNPYFIIGCSLVTSFLLVANLPLFGLKFKTIGWKGNETRNIFLGTSLLLLIFLHFIAIPIIIICYILFSIIDNFLNKRKHEVQS